VEVELGFLHRREFGMDGKESPEMLDRCKIWDWLFTGGAASVDEIATKFGWRKPRIKKLIEHEWFTVVSGVAKIATSRGAFPRQSAA
jgi:hypothetical protein